MINSICSQVSQYFVLALSLSPLASLGVIYFFRSKIQSIWKRLGVLTLLSPILMLVLLFGNGAVCVEANREWGTSGSSSVMFLMLAGFVLIFILSVVGLVVFHQKKAEDINAWFSRNGKRLVTSMAVVVATVSLLVAGIYLVKWAKPSARLQRAALKAEEAGNCFEAVETYKQLVQQKNDQVATAYARWARVLISCPDKSVRNPKEAKVLVETAADAGSVDNEILDIASCVFAAGGDFPRALKVANENTFTDRIKLFTNKKVCFE